MTSDEWGGWIDHNHSGLPVRAGTIVQIAYESGSEPVVCAEDGPWWHGGGRKRWKGQRENWSPIIRYRVKRPRGLTMLRDLIVKLSAPERQKEDA